ncbi:efflux RND transporter periplasmic adaptor subunit [Parapusillimonas sp. JC17]|uniref:efflux RND transporter periplasmic adaptor subunit n=1 Tax=Parapusillimonas sp. JC17 TaxID=3445768 RepID=UPI003FA0D380
MKQQKIFRRLGSLSGLAFVAALAGCSEPVAQSGPPPLPEVGVVTTQTQTLSMTTELAGRTNPYMVSELRPQVGGILKERLFKEGGEVRAGDILYQIDDAIFKARHNSAKAALAKAEANLKVTRLTASRYKELVKINAVSKQENDSAQAELLRAQADVAAAKAALDMEAINLAYTRVEAPISGRIGQSSVTPGALLSANQPDPLAVIQQLDPIYVDVTQSSVELLRLREALASGALKRSDTAAASVKLKLEDGSVYEHPGELQFSEVRVEPGTGMVTLRAVFPNPDNKLLPGMYVRAQIEEGLRDDAMLLPQRAVMRDGKGTPTALVLNPDNKVELRVLETSRAIGDQWLVERGISPGERLIVEGVQKVRPGAEARAVEAGAPAPSLAATSAAAQ